MGLTQSVAPRARCDINDINGLCENLSEHRKGQKRGRSLVASGPSFREEGAIDFWMRRTRRQGRCVPTRRQPLRVNVRQRRPSTVLHRLQSRGTCFRALRWSTAYLVHEIGGTLQSSGNCGAFWAFMRRVNINATRTLAALRVRNSSVVPWKQYCHRYARCAIAGIRGSIGRCPLSISDCLLLHSSTEPMRNRSGHERWPPSNGKWSFVGIAATPAWASHPASGR